MKTKFIDEITASAIEAWCEVVGITSGTIFRGVAKSGLLLDDPLSTKGGNRAVQRVAKAAGIAIGRVMLARDWERHGEGEILPAIHHTG